MKRSWLVQFLFLVIVAAALFALASNAVSNLSRQGIAMGFDFLSKPAGFDIIFHLLDFNDTSSYGHAFFVAAVNTLAVSILGIIIATIIGFLAGIGLLSGHPLVRYMCRIYVEVIRNIPLLLQLFFWYFAVLRGLPSPRNSYQLFDAIFLNIRGLYLPKINWDSLSQWIAFITVAALVLPKVKRLRPYHKAFLGLAIFGFIGLMITLKWTIPSLTGFNFTGGFVIIPEFAALCLALSLYTGSFIAEVVRSGISSVSKGQNEAALALGLNQFDIYRCVIIPQAMRLIIPPLTNQYLNLTKNSSLGAAIAYPELVLVFASTILNHTGQAIEVIFLTMIFYLSISLLISFLMNFYNRAPR